MLAASFPAGASAPTTVVVPSGGDVAAVHDAAAGLDGVSQVGEPQEGPPGTRFAVTLVPEPFSTEDVLVGGPTAEEYDVTVASTRDTPLLPPLILLVVLVILAALLRSVVAPLLLVGTVIVSFLAALGISVVLFDVVFGAPGGVITSAGVVLAGTFAVLGVLPLWALFQIGFLVGFGVLPDTLVVRSVLVPAGR